MPRVTVLSNKKVEMKARGPQEPKLAGHKKQEGASRGQPVVALTAEQKEIARLREEVATLRMERDVAKQAATSFARYLQRRIGG